MNNTTPTYLPLPAFVAEAKTLPAEITPAQARELFAIALGNLKAAEPLKGYDPLKRHRPLKDGEENDYSSRFNTITVPTIGDDDSKCFLEEGHGGREKAIVVRVEKKDVVGVYYPSVVPHNAGITVFSDPHGHGLLPVNTLKGDWSQIKPEQAKEFTFSISNTEGEENCGWVLSSAYPGPQDVTPDMTGLQAGSMVPYEEAVKRRLRVRNLPVKDGKIVD